MAGNDKLTPFAKTDNEQQNQDQAFSGQFDDNRHL
jgi:hypothetical protein